MDKELETGQYFLSKEQKRAKQQKEREQKHEEAAKRREERRGQAFIPPEEPVASKPTPSTSSSLQIDLAAIREKVKKAQKGIPVFKKKS